MIDKDYLITCLEEETENSRFDFKKEVYDFQITKKKEEFLTDVLSFSNGHAKGNRYIICGIKLFPNNDREFIGIMTDKLQDGSVYQTLVSENIEPPLEIETFCLEYDGRKYLIHKIPGKDLDPPYMLRKKFDKLEKGFMRIRRGEKNDIVTRKDIDRMYQRKSELKSSSFQLNSDRLRKCKNLKWNLSGRQDDAINHKQIRDLIEDIESINIVPAQTGLFSFPDIYGQKVKINNLTKSIISQYTEANQLVISENFFDVGDLSWRGLPIEGYGISYKGTDEEKRKYKSICQLTQYLLEEVDRVHFFKQLLPLYFLDVWITNTGVSSDNDIELNLIFPKDVIILPNEFPSPKHMFIDKILEDDNLDSLIELKGTSNINSSTIDKGQYPQNLTHGGYLESYLKSDDAVQYFREVLNWWFPFEIIFEEKEVYLRIVIPKIKAGESIFLPCRLFLKKSIDKIKYSVSSHKSQRKFESEMIIRT